MSKHFTETHEAVRASLRKFIEKEIIPNVDEWEKNKVCEREIFRKMGEQGFFGVSFPEEVGGMGLDLWGAVTVTEELAHANIGGLAMSLYAHTYLPLPMITALGTAEQKEKYVRPALEGKKVAALGITEPGAGSDVNGIRTTCVDMGDHYLVNGQKCFITNGTMADFVLLAVRTGPDDYNMSTLIVETDSPGFSAVRMDNKLGMHSSDTGHLFFDNVRVPKENLVGHFGMGFFYLMNNIQEERLIAAATATFAAEAALEKAKRYTREREAFGRSINKFQVIRHKLATMATKVEAMRAMAFRAIEEFEEKGSGAVKVITMAKAFCCEEAQYVVNEALQVHGGWGYMEDYGIARSWRDMRLLTLGAGTTEIMNEIISKIVIDEKKHERQFIQARNVEAVKS
jgi:alkylation response protein AidB-like acyl-CoA dehydrogenase